MSPINQRPRIVHVYKDVYPPVEGGVERVIHLMARLTAEEFDPRIVVAARTCRGHRRTIAGGVEVTEVPSAGRLLSTPLAPGFIAALRRSGADLFHFHVPHPTGEMAYLLSRLRTPAVATYHSDVVRQRAAMVLYGSFFRRFLRRMHTIMPTSQRYMETSPWLAEHRDRCRVVPLGYPLEEYAATPAIDRRAEELRRQHGDFVLFLGCLRAYKGLQYLLEAADRLPGVRFVIAGDGAQGPALHRMAERLGLGERVVFTGRVDQAEAVALLHAATLMALPAHQRSEAFGLCQVEAMACGLPVVSTDLPTAVPEVNVHNESGLIVPPARPAALAEAIARLLADTDLRHRLGEGGRRRAEKFYRAERVAKEVAKIYRQTLTDR